MEQVMKENVPPNAGDGKRDPMVFTDGMVVRTNSLDVAGYFEKSHAHVMRDIRALLDAEEEEHASKIGLMFRPAAREVVVGNGGKRLDPCYDMDRDGFTLLAMGFTGTKSLRFKLRYIEAFNTMEATLSQRGPATIEPPNADGSLAAESIPVRLRLVEITTRLWGDEVGRETYLSAKLPEVPGMRRQSPQGDLFRRPANSDRDTSEGEG
ncbi:hypothetical protein GAY28_10130 [Azospirillum brasilense]|nr:hypothetical protein [Azospirillum brasilense]